MISLDNNANKHKIALIAVGYNRLQSIERLLKSLNEAIYPNNDTPLVICIDASNDQLLYDYVTEFNWAHGDKYVIIQQKRLGLKQHIFKCGDLSIYFRAIVLFEDDIFASPYFYNYVISAVNKYEYEDRIAQISLYCNETNGYIGLPFRPLYTGYDTFLTQDVSTWGECWTNKMWMQFKDWLAHNKNFIISNLDIPEQIKSWENAWSKYFIEYIIANNKYILFPYQSLTTNFSDAGTHIGISDNSVQVNLMFGDKTYLMPSFDKMERYDSFFNNIRISEWIGIELDRLCIDLYGMRKNVMYKEYILTCRDLNLKKICSFGLKFRPIELNIKYNIPGNDIFLYSTGKRMIPELVSSNNLTGYYLQGFNLKIQLKYLLSMLWRVFKNKVHGL